MPNTHVVSFPDNHPLLLLLRERLREDYVRNQHLRMKELLETWSERLGDCPHEQTIRNFMNLKNNRFQWRVVDGFLQLLCTQTLNDWMREHPDDEDCLLGKKNQVFQDQTFLGLVKIYQQYDPLIIIDILTNSALEEIWMFGISLDSAVQHRANQLMSALRKEVRLKFLFFKSDEDLVEYHTRNFGITRKHLCLESESTISRIVELMEQWACESQNKEKAAFIEAKVTNLLPSMRVFVSDPFREQGVTFIVPGINRSQSKDLPMFECRNVRDGVWSAYFQGLQKEWNAKENISLQKLLCSSSNDYVTNSEAFFAAYPVPEDK